MGCRCNERRQAIVRSLNATAQGDVETVAKEATFVVKSTVQDVGNVFRQSVAAAKARLMRGR
jgi:hypothetical protein